MRKNNKRILILETALGIAARGSRHLTMENIARASGVSKGGLFYHFPTKDELLKAMLEHLTQTNIEIIEDRPAERTNILVSLLEARERTSEHERRASKALLAIATERSDLLAGALDYYEVQFSEVRDHCKDERMATVLLLASEGIRFLEVLGLSPFSEEFKAEITSFMLKQAENL